jgi:hypothetical protein
MPNKYCNLTGSNKISQEYPLITAGFAAVETDTLVLQARVEQIITTPIDGATAAQEVVDARQSTVKSATYATLDARLESSETDIKVLNNGSKTTLSPTYGQQLIQIPEVSTPIKLSLTGRAYTNLLGKDGDCEVTSRFTNNQSTLALDTSKKVFGTNAIKITATANPGNLSKQLSLTLFDVTKYYMFSAYVANGNATNISILKDATGGGVQKQSSLITGTTMTRVVCKSQPSDNNAGNEIIVTVNGTSTQYAYVDGIMINEISASDYALSDAALMAKYPYVESYAALQNPYFEVANATSNPTRKERFVVEGLFTDDDTVTIENGKVSGSLYWKHRTLFGKDYDWQYDSDSSGFKQIKITSIQSWKLTNQATNSTATEIKTKYDGSILKPWSPSMVGDECWTENATTPSFIYLNVKDTDTGWAESIAPNADEVKAYMNGWKATANNGTRYTTWVSVVDGTTAPTAQLIDFVKANIAVGYEGYRLHYKLATPEPITDVNTHVHGIIWDLVKGDNYVTVDSGIVLGEVANPALGAGYYKINSSDVSAPLKYIPDSIVNIYKNGVLDTQNWTLVTTGQAIGNMRAYIIAANFDTNATYTADYVILKTLHAQSFSGLTLEYYQSVLNAIDGLNKIVETKQAKDSSLDNLIDLSVYEKGYSRSNFWFELGAGTVMLDFIIPLYNKRTLPIVSLSNFTCLVNNVDKTSQFKLSLIDFSYRNFVTARYTTTDSTTITAIKASSITGKVDYVLDCRGRI